MAVDEEVNVISETENATDIDKKVVDELKPRVYTLEILRLIKEAQQQHGLRHSDYQRYRGYCSRRIRRLRKVLKLPQGDRRHFKRRDITEVYIANPKADERCLQLPLMQAERAWSLAMQLRQEANTEPRKRFHLVQRLRKSCVYAAQLEELCKSELCDARTKLESKAYTAWIQGTLQFELQLWQKAAESLTQAQVVYSELAEALPLDEQGPYKQRVDELAPSLRYCAYNIGENKAIDLRQFRGQGLLDNLDTLMEQAKQKREEAFAEAEWRGNKFSVRPERARLFLMSIQELDTSLKNASDVSARIALLEQVLMDCKDAIGGVRDEMKADPKLKAAAGEPITGSQILLAYLSYIRLTRTIERNLCLIEQGKTAPEGKKSKFQDLARLYEIILQNVTELQQLPGFENDDKYQAEIGLKAKTYKGFRCFYIAKTLELMKRFKDAYALYERAAAYARSVISDKLSDESTKKLLKDLIHDIEANKFSAHAQSVLEEIDEGEQDATKIVQKKHRNKKPLIDRLDEYVEDPSLLTKTPNVVKLPPEMEPIPCKPLFFDLAHNLVQFPDLEDKVEPKSKKEGAGISGFVKGLWGWGGKK